MPSAVSYPLDGNVKLTMKSEEWKQSGYKINVSGRKGREVRDKFNERKGVGGVKSGTSVILMLAIVLYAVWNSV